MFVFIAFDQRDRTFLCIQLIQKIHYMFITRKNYEKLYEIFLFILREYGSIYSHSM